jgi:hypothetical protein
MHKNKEGLIKTKNKNMKKILRTLVAFSCPFVHTAQISLDQSDLPQIGDTQIVTKLDSAQSSPVLPGPSGANQVWNFSTLSGFLDTSYFIDPSTTPNFSFFPGATLAEGNGGGKFIYYSAAGAGMSIVGFDENQLIALDQLPLEFPVLTYGATVNHTARGLFNVVSSATYDAFTAQLSSTADAWGTITTPAGTVSALRVYTTETTYDSSYVNGVGTQNSTTTGHYYYKWYAKNLGWPVLQIAKGSFSEPNFQQVFFANDLSSVTGIKNPETAPDFKMYPNPTSGKIFADGREFVSLEIYSVCGKKIYEKTKSGQETVIELDLSGLPKGIYFAKIRSGSGVHTQKIILY